MFSTFLLSRKLSLYPTSDCASSLDCVDAVDPFVLEKAVSTLQLKLRTDKEAHSHQLERLNSEIVSLNSAIDEAKLKIVNSPTPLSICVYKRPHILTLIRLS